MHAANLQLNTFSTVKMPVSLRTKQQSPAKYKHQITVADITIVQPQ